MNEISPESTEQQASLGQVLASARKEANLTIEAVADRLKLSPKQITKLEQDDYTHFRAYHLCKRLHQSVLYACCN